MMNNQSFINSWFNNNPFVNDMFSHLEVDTLNCSSVAINVVSVAKKREAAAPEVMQNMGSSRVCGWEVSLEGVFLLMQDMAFSWYIFIL